MKTQLIALLAITGALGLGWALHHVQKYVQQHILGRAGYTAKKLLTGNEVDFYHRLRVAAGAKWTVLPQVSMGALMDTRLLPAHPQYWEARSEFSSKICDFVICDSKTLKPQLIVELDDCMHEFDKDRVRDSLVARAGYRTLRFWSRKKPTTDELRVHLERALALN